MKFSEIKDLTVEELHKRNQQLREELFEAKMKHSLGQLADHLQIRKVRRDIARIQTALSAKLSR